MKKFDFIIQNAKILSELDINVDGFFQFSCDNFDFAYHNLEAVLDDGCLIFRATAGDFKLECRIDQTEIKKFVDYIAYVKSSEARKVVIEAIEDDFRNEAELNQNDAKESLNDAQRTYDEAVDKYNCLLESMRKLKGAWGIS